MYDVLFIPNNVPFLGSLNVRDFFFVSGRVNDVFLVQVCLQDTVN